MGVYYDTVYIQTQILENDGLRNVDQESSLTMNMIGNFKFGNEFIISVVDKIQDAVSYVASIYHAKQNSHKTISYFMGRS